MKYIIPFVIFICLGILFLGQGITGLVIGESCCFPSEDCSLENVCDTAIIQNPKPAAVHYLWLFVGSKLIIFFAFLLYRRLINQHHHIIPISKIFKKHQ